MRDLVLDKKRRRLSQYEETQERAPTDSDDRFTDTFEDLLDTSHERYEYVSVLYVNSRNS